MPQGDSAASMAAIEADQPEQQRIIDENGKANGASATLRWTTRLLAGLLALSMLLNGTYVYSLVYVFPLKTWIWTKDARAVCDARSISVPSVAAARVKDFAAGAAVELNSYDYLSNPRILSAATEKYMTAAGRVAFYAALQESGFVQTVEKNYMVLESVSSGPPYIRKEGVRPGDKRYFWEVEVPIRLFFYVRGDFKPDNRIMVVTVVQVEPSPTNQNGIAVDGIVSTQETMRRGPVLN